MLAMHAAEFTVSSFNGSYFWCDQTYEILFSVSYAIRHLQILSQKANNACRKAFPDTIG